SGGSIPIVPELGASGAPVVLTGIGLPDDGLHSPNEKLDLEQLWAGVAVFGRFLELFGERGGRRREVAAETAEAATAYPSSSGAASRRTGPEYRASVRACSSSTP